LSAANFTISPPGGMRRDAKAATVGFVTLSV
jgi:hypothetical protein